MDNNGYYCGRSRCCYSIILTVLIALLSGTLGLIFGSLFALPVLFALPAIIAFAVVLAVLIVIFLIIRYCACQNRRY